MPSAVCGKLPSVSASDQLGLAFTPAARRTWTVHDLVAAVRTHVEREYTDIWVEGEISNFRAHDSGHLYFTLKDENAQIRVVLAGFERAFPCSGCWTTGTCPIAGSTVRAPRG